MNIYRRQLEQTPERERRFNKRYRLAVVGGIALLFAIAILWLVVVI